MLYKRDNGTNPALPSIVCYSRTVGSTLHVYLSPIEFFLKVVKSIITNITPRTQ